MLVVALMLVLDLSAGAAAMVPGEDDNIHDENYHLESITSNTESEVPELKCQDEKCPEKYLGIGFPPWDASPAVEEPYWWVNFATDKDANGMEDSLQ